MVRMFEQGQRLSGDVFTFQHRRQVAALAARYQLPAMYPLREYVDSGGLMAYGADRTILFRRAADYVDKMLTGTMPWDLPIKQPTKFELVVNLKTANALGLKIPESILLRADQVIR
jgi:putative ABC transport system substrate-binding protein